MSVTPVLRPYTSLEPQLTEITQVRKVLNLESSLVGAECFVYVHVDVVKCVKEVRAILTLAQVSQVVLFFDEVVPFVAVHVPDRLLLSSLVLAHVQLLLHVVGVKGRLGFDLVGVLHLCQVRIL